MTSSSPSTLFRLLVKQETVLKQEPISSSQLPSNKLQKLPAGTLLVLQSYGEAANNHFRISLKDIDFKGLTGNWHAFKDHVQIITKSLTSVTTIKQSAYNQQTKDVVEILSYVNQKTAPAQGGFVKLVFNQDTFIKRQPVETRFLQANYIQQIPAGTELVLLTNKPSTQNSIKFPLESRHLKFDLKDVEFKGYSQDWYVFDEHAGLQINS